VSFFALPPGLVLILIVIFLSVGIVLSLRRAEVEE
jgi:hypothetical protein